MMQYEGENAHLVDQNPCAGIRADLKMCLLESDCVKKQKKTPRECLKSFDASVPNECYALRTTFFECKRSLLDNRTRFRGRKGY
ncbi:Cytochrome c oxidase assembly factor 5 [Cryptotermes secundus]|uniref:Cytochrome c oxidase assembly factor 5 n=1 Tax=Cryptotermes secundus TaxID=105785 RepID=A0A2J7RBX0_9NEOP|nr:cytochrome c oxidase assembly factor 5 [Cryptotermes secundus]XP_023703009.1 cytochrome c oxidase assembly factor 5 [Cryptotermes secundus]XP_023703010.1 cytochrome c oxidase assembly factor 5 [Cryptotermes secundus]PNF38329.1 Cytochrome c oxidase assembly factor 5 [Cryptotermes secundus]